MNPVTLSDGAATSTYSISAGQYVPQSDGSDSYTSTTAFCPPPGIGESYEYTTWIPASVGRGGDYVTTT